MKIRAFVVVAAVAAMALPAFGQYPNRCKNDGYGVIWDNTSGQFKCSATPSGTAASLKFGTTVIDLSPTPPTINEFLKYDGSHITGASSSAVTLSSWSSVQTMQNGHIALAAANRVDLVQFVLPGQLSLSTVTVVVGVADSSGNYSFGVYDSSGTLVASTAVTSLPSTGVEQFSISGGPVTLDPGTYYFAWTGDSTTAALNITSGLNFLSLLSDYYPTETSSSGVPPSSITLPAQTGGQSQVFGIVFILS